jgi:hypothetical protein
LPETPTPRTVRLENTRAIRRELVRLYGEGRRGLMSVADLSRYAHVLMILSNIGRDADLEARLEALEKALAKEHPT